MIPVIHWLINWSRILSFIDCLKHSRLAGRDWLFQIPDKPNVSLTNISQCGPQTSEVCILNNIYYNSEDILLGAYIYYFLGTRSRRDRGYILKQLAEDYWVHLQKEWHLPLYWVILIMTVCIWGLYIILVHTLNSTAHCDMCFVSFNTWTILQKLLYVSSKHKTFV